MVDKLGPIPEKFLNLNKSFKDQYNKMMKDKSPEARKSFDEQFPSASPEARDLLEKMLKYLPEEWITVLQAMQHPYLKDLWEENAGDGLEEPHG